MKILGIKGKWFPVSDLVGGVILADHRYGAEASVSFATDYYFDKSMYWGEMLSFKNNLKATCFINSDTSFWKSQVPDIEKTGKISHDIYFMTDKWVNPVTGVYEVIPDYYSATWTSAGAAIFANAVSGQPKPTTDGGGGAVTATRYPNHGQQMYDVSNGDFGYDTVNSTIGQSNISETMLLDEYIRIPMEINLGRKVPCISYRNGITNASKILIGKYLGGRNSAGRLSGSALTSYGFRQSDGTKLGNFFYSDAQILANPDLGFVPNHHINRQNTIQYEACLTANGEGGDSYATAQTTFLAYLTSLINGNGTTIPNLFISGGWFQEFTHWHNMNQSTGWAGTKGDLRAKYEEYISTLSSLLQGHTVNRSGYGEIVSYHYQRDRVKRIDTYIRDNTVRFALRFDDIDTSMFISPLSIVVDFTGTVMEGKNFKRGKGCSSIRSLGNNVFVVDIDKSGEIEVDIVGEYNNLTPPVTSHSYTSNVLTITADKPVRCVVYGLDTDSWIELHRDNNLSTEKSITIQNAVAVGIVDEYGESKLITI